MFFIEMIEFQLTPVLFVVVSLLLISIIFSLYSQSNRKAYTSLVLNQNGTVEIDALCPLILHQNSRIGWFGCWLILTPLSTALSSARLSKTPKRLFLYKDRFSAIDYSRLCRHILKNKCAASRKVMFEELK